MVTRLRYRRDLNLMEYKRKFDRNIARILIPWIEGEEGAEKRPEDIFHHSSGHLMISDVLYVGRPYIEAE